MSHEGKGRLQCSHVNTAEIMATYFGLWSYYNTNLDVLLQQLIPCSSKNDNWLSCANFLRLMFYASMLAACLLLSLILSMACCALPGMARGLEFPSSTSPVHYPEGCAAHSMASTRPWRGCIGLCRVSVGWEFVTRILQHKFLSVFFCQHVLAPQTQRYQQVISFF